MSHVDRKFAKAMQTEIRAALEVIAAKHGMILDLPGGSFTPYELTLRVKFIVKDDSSNPLANTPHGQAFIQQAILFGLKPEDLGRKIVLDGEEFQVVGLRPKAHKRPVMIKTSAGRIQVCQLRPVVEALRAK